MAGRGEEPVIYREDIGGCVRLSGRNILVTAGTLGIGRAIVERCIQENANVFFCSRKQENVHSALEELQKRFGRDKKRHFGGCACNVSDPQQLKAFVEAGMKFFGDLKEGNGKVEINGIVSNAGVNPVAGPSLKLSDSVYKKIMSVNLDSHFQLIQFCHPYLARNSSIVFISSVGGFQPSFPVGIYGVSKTALIALTRVLSQELGTELSCRVNCIAPGVVRTRMAELFWKAKPKDGDLDGEFKEEKMPKVSLQRFGDPEDMAGTAAFLLSDDSAYMTGETLVVSGGTDSRL